MGLDDFTVFVQEWEAKSSIALIAPNLTQIFVSCFGLLSGTSAGFLRTHQSLNTFRHVFTQQLRECVLGSGKKACPVLDTPHLQHHHQGRVKTPRGKLANSIFTPFADKATTLLLIINGKNRTLTMMHLLLKNFTCLCARCLSNASPMPRIWEAWTLSSIVVTQVTYRISVLDHCQALHRPVSRDAVGLVVTASFP